MVKRLFAYSVILALCSCHAGYDLDTHNMGDGPGYFVECYCTPGSMFNLTATRIAPISEDQVLDYSIAFETWIETNERFRLWHSLFRDGKIVYNYASDQRLDNTLTDSVRLDMTAPDGTKISAATIIPPQAVLDYARIADRRVEAGYTPKGDDRYYILTICCWGNGHTLSDTRFFRSHTNKEPVSLSCDIPEIPASGIQIDSVVVELKRMTREGYHYQLSIKEAQDANRDPLIQPPPLQGNISGALGIFTCYTRDRRKLRLETSGNP